MAAGRRLGQGHGQRTCGFIGCGLETWEQTASGPRSVTPVGNSVGLRRGREQRRDVGRFWPQPVGDSVG